MVGYGKRIGITFLVIDHAYPLNRGLVLKVKKVKYFNIDPRFLEPGKKSGRRIPPAADERFGQSQVDPLIGIHPVKFAGPCIIW